MPRVSIGLPVYNGEDFVAEAIEWLLSQTYEDFELIILDNASTDRTAEICRDYARRDSRIRYHRNAKNIGPCGNFNEAFHLARGEYFKWAAHDDCCAPNYLRRCVEGLDGNQDAALCHSLARIIDDEGKPVKDYDSGMQRLTSPRVKERFAELLVVEHACFEVFGLIRRDVLEKTSLIESYMGSDRLLLAELSLYGKLLTVPERLFLSRDHSDRPVRIPSEERAVTWCHPNLKTKFAFPHWRCGAKYARSITRAPLTLRERTRCLGHVFSWTLRNWRVLRGDLRIAAERLTGISLRSRCG